MGRDRIFTRAILGVLLSTAGAVSSPGQADTPFRKTFTETDALFRNPGQGWMAFSRMPGKEPRLPCAVAYFRLDWGDLEPEEGKYAWKAIDEAAAAWKARGARVAFRIMTANAHSAGPYSSPKWLFDSGCKSFEYEEGGGDPTKGGARLKRVEPDYADPLYLKKHGAFLRAVGARYDGHPDVEFLDIGSYGIWGEWHTPHPVSLEVRRQIVDLYLAAFRKTPLASMSDDAEVLDYALSRGTGFRRDGVGSPWHEQNWIGSKKYAGVKDFARAWERAPAVFEWYGDYDYLKSRQWSFEKAIKFMLDSHVTFINDNVGRVPDAERPQLEKLARLAGYRFVLREASHAAKAARGTRLEVRMKWSNVGVARLYRPHPLTLFLLDAGGKEVHRVKAAADPGQWLPGDHAVTEKLEVPRSINPGTYTVGLALVEASTGQPAIQLGCDASHADRLYTLGSVRVE
jgi:hypothetical protein